MPAIATQFARRSLLFMPGDSLRKMMKSGLLPLVHAHLFSLGIMREIFARQLDQGQVPGPDGTV